MGSIFNSKILSMTSKNTEILATIGPATINILKKLYENGMNGIRINSSHGTREFHKSVIEKSRKTKIAYDIASYILLINQQFLIFGQLKHCSLQLVYNCLLVVNIY